MSDLRVPPANQPRPADYGFDLDEVLASIVGLHSFVPADAFTAETLGTERGGNGVVIDDGLILTIGYLITEAQQVWLHLSDGRVMEGHALGFDATTGFGLVQALGRLNIDPIPLGSSATAQIVEYGREQIDRHDHVDMLGLAGTLALELQRADPEQFALIRDQIGRAHV